MDMPRKEEDKVNLVMIILIGVCGSLLVWISIVGLQAYYDATAGVEEERQEVQGQDVAFKGQRGAQLARLQKAGDRSPNAGPKFGKRWTIQIEAAEALVIRDHTSATLIPGMPPIQPKGEAVYGRAEITIPPADGDSGTAPASPTAAPADGSEAPAGGAATPGAAPATPPGTAPPSNDPPAAGAQANPQ